MLNNKKSKLEAELISKKINPTAMRILVYEYLKTRAEAVTLGDIENSFEQSDRVTLYRTLKTFEQKGLIHKISTGNGTQYALCHLDCSEDKHRDTHVHFICNQCKKTICLTQVQIPAIVIPSGFQFDEYEVLAKGVCQMCLSNSTSNSVPV